MPIKQVRTVRRVGVGSITFSAAPEAMPSEKHVASPPPPQFRARGRRLMSIAPVASPVLATLRVAASTRESPSPARRVAPARSRVFERVVVRTRAVPSDTTSASVMSADVPSLRLVYFDVMAKGMQVTMVAHHSGLSWQGKPEGFAWRDGIKPRAPFGQLPLLFVGGDDTAPVAQTTAIAAVIGKLAGTDGAENTNDFAMSSMLVAEAEDIYAALQKGQPTLYAKIGSGVKTEQTHEELWTKSLPHHLGCLEKLCDVDGRFTSTGVTSGEMFLWGVLHQVALLAKAFAFDGRPKLAAYYERIAAMERTVEVLEGKSPAGSMAQYFVAGPIH